MRLHYEGRGRPEALANLDKAVAEAERLIELQPQTGLLAPRPYPSMARPGLRWMKVRRYWFGYRNAQTAVVVLVFYDAADMPRRTHID